MPSPFDIIRALNEKSDLEYTDSDYVPFIVNRGLSFIKDTLFFANEMNKYAHLEKSQQNDFYKFGIPKGKRFGKWIKKVESDETLDFIANYFCINKNVAAQYAQLLSAEHLQQIQEKMSRGGK